MKRPWIHRVSVLLAVCAFVLVLSGAAVTSGLQIFPAHQAVAALAGILTIALAVSAGLGSAGWITLGAGLLDALLGYFRGGAVLHACIAPLFFSATVALCVLTSAGWARGPDPVPDSGWPSLRSLGVATPVLVLLQISLGAAFRHQAMGVMSHVLGAMVVALVALFMTICVMQQCPEHRALKPAAVWFISLTSVQVFLGIGAFTMRIVSAENTPAVVVVTVTHVCVGALTLAASVVLAMQIRRNVYKPSPRTDASPS